MTTARKQVKPLDVVATAELLGWKPRQLTRMWRRKRFPEPVGGTADEARWNSREVWRWAAENAPARAAAMPIKHWASHAEPAEFGQAQQVANGVIHDWYVGEDQVPLRILWPTGDFMAVDPAEAARLAPRAAQVLLVGPGFGVFGPELEMYSAAGKHLGSASWLDLAHTLGGPVPYWPHNLRTPKLLLEWAPGDSLVTVPAVPSLDTTPLLRLAAMVELGSPAQRTLLNLAQTFQTQATSGAQQDLEILASEHRYDMVLAAAEPLTTPEIGTEDLAEPIRRAGWLDVLSRHDTLAVEVVQSLLNWNGGEALPFCKCEEVDPTTSPYVREWADRLEPVSRRTAAFEIAQRRSGEPVEYLIDPETDAPAVRLSSGRLLTAVPQRLPAQSPLSEVILTRPIWIRTQDGMLYLAPLHHYFGLNWGYGGSGPGTLALLLDRLLDDINAPAADSVQGAAEGLDVFTEIDWEEGTVFTREQLEQARNGTLPEVS